MDAFDIRDWIDIAFYILGMAITIAVVKTDIKWIKQWCRDHKEEDEKRFTEVSRDIRELRRVSE